MNDGESMSDGRARGEAILKGAHQVPRREDVESARLDAGIIGVGA